MQTSTIAMVLLTLAVGPQAASAAGPVVAQTAPSAQGAPAKPAPPAPASARSADPVTANAETADAVRLEKARGGDAAMASEANLGGIVSNNSAINVVTGSNLIDSSFNNASGLPMVIQNSGANVLIQNATVINLQLR